MEATVDYGRFSDRLAGRTDLDSRWGLLREFQLEWGLDVVEAESWDWIDEARARLAKLRDDPALRAAHEQDDENEDFEGVDLSLPVPRALDDWWALPFNSFVQQPRLYWTHPLYPPTIEDGFDPYELPPDHPARGGSPDGRVCVFMAEYQYCNEWGYAAAQAGQEDPIALVRVGDGWEVQADRLSAYLLQLAVMRVPPRLGWSVMVEEPSLPVTDLPTLGFLPWRELEARTQLYGAPDAIVYHDTGEDPEPLRACGRTRESLIRLGATLGIDWDAEITQPPSSS